MPQNGTTSNRNNQRSCPRCPSLHPAPQAVPQNGTTPTSTTSPHSSRAVAPDVPCSRVAAHATLEGELEGCHAAPACIGKQRDGCSGFAATLQQCPRPAAEPCPAPGWLHTPRRRYELEGLHTPLQPVTGSKGMGEAALPPPSSSAPDPQKRTGTPSALLQRQPHRRSRETAHGPVAATRGRPHRSTRLGPNLPPRQYASRQNAKAQPDDGLHQQHAAAPAALTSANLADNNLNRGVPSHGPRSYEPPTAPRFKGPPAPIGGTQGRSGKRPP